MKKFGFRAPQKSDRLNEFLPCYSAYLNGPAQEQVPKTVVVFGAPRGGTTMVAGALIRSGLYLGDNLPINCEDPAFNIKQLRSKGATVVPSIIETIRQRNDTRDGHWGWKFPRAVVYLDEIFQHLVNPHFVIVYRDPLATASREIEVNGSVIEPLGRILDLQRRNFAAATKYKVPTLFVSYDRAVIARRDTVYALCDFVGLPYPKNVKKILAYMEPGAYKEV